MGTKLYKPKRKKRKEKLYLIDKLEIGGIVIASAAIIIWSGWSVTEALKPAPVISTYEVDTDSIAEYLSDLDNSQTENVEVSADAESESEPEKEKKENKDTDKKDASESKSEEKPEAQENQQETKEKEQPTEAPTAQKKSADEQVEQAKNEETQKKDTQKKEQTSEQPAEEQATEEPEEQQIAASAPLTYTAKEPLNVRKNPDPTVNNIIASYKAGEAINVIEDDTTNHGGWYKINKDGVEGYIAKLFVEVK